MAELTELSVKISADSRELKRELGAITTATEKTTDGMKRAFGALGNVVAGIGLANLASDIKNASVQMQGLEARLNATTGGATQASEAMTFLRQMADAQKVDLIALSDAYLRLLPAVQTNKISMEEMREILRLMNDNFAALQLSTSEQQLAFLGLSQMLTSGTVTMEDMRQVTDRLPGSFDAIATAIGVSASDLRKMISTGTVTAEMLKGPLLEAMRKNEGAAKKMSDTYTASITSLGNVFREMSSSLGLVDALSMAIRGLELVLITLWKASLSVRLAFNLMTDDQEESLKISKELEKVTGKLAERNRELAASMPVFGLGNKAKIEHPLTKSAEGAIEKNKELQDMVDDTKDKESDKDKKARKEREKLAKEEEEGRKRLAKDTEKEEADRVADLKKQTDDWLENNKTAYDEITEQIGWQSEQWADDISAALARGEVSFKSFRNMANNILMDVSQAIIRASIVSPIVSGLTSAITGGIGAAFGSSSGLAQRGAGGAPIPVLRPTTNIKGFAAGGQPPINRLSVVGENGPELFMPKMAGTVIPNGQGLGGGVSVTNVFNISPGLESTIAAAIMNAAPIIEQRAKQGVFQALERGGSESRSIGRRA